MRKTVVAILAAFILTLAPAGAFGAYGSSSSSSGSRSYTPSAPKSSPAPSAPKPSAPAPAPKPAPSAPKPSTSAPKVTPKPSSNTPKATPAPSKKPSGAGAGTASFSKSKPTTSRPSTGKLPQKPTRVLVPSTRPSGIRVPSGHNYRTDYGRFQSNPRYADPYSRDYYGNPNSSLHYLYLYALADNISDNDPVRYEQVRSTNRDDENESWLWWLLIPGLLVVAGGGAYFLLKRKDTI